MTMHGKTARKDSRTKTKSTTTATRVAREPLAILLDRMGHALAVEGHEMARTALLKVAAATFGHRNTQATTALAKSGALTPPAAIPVSTVTLADGTRLVVMRDPIAGAPYAVDESFLERAEERRDDFGVSPYGHLLDMSEAHASAVPDASGAVGRRNRSEATHGPSSLDGVIELHVGIVSSYRDVFTFHGWTAEDVTRQLAVYARRNHDMDDLVGEPIDLMADADVVRHYFEQNASEETLERKVVGMPDPAAERERALAAAEEPFCVAAIEAYADGEFACCVAGDPEEMIEVLGDTLAVHVVARTLRRGGCVTRAQALARLDADVADAAAVAEALGEAAEGNDDPEVTTREGMLPWERVAIAAYRSGEAGGRLGGEAGYGPDASRRVKGTVLYPILVEMRLEEGCDSMREAHRRAAALLKNLRQARRGVAALPV